MTFIDGVVSTLGAIALLVSACWIGYDIGFKRGYCQGYKEGNTTKCNYFKDGNQVRFCDGVIKFVPNDTECREVE